MLAQSTSHCYFVLPDLHKVLPSTTLYYKGLHKILPSITLYYKGRTKTRPSTTCTTKLAPRISLYYLHNKTCTCFLQREDFTDRSFYTKQAFTHSELLRREAFTHSKFFAVKLLHPASFYPAELWQQAFTRRRFTHSKTDSKLLHTEAFKRSFYTNLKDMLHTKAFMVLRAMAPEITVPLQNRISGPKQKKTILKHLKRFC